MSDPGRTVVVARDRVALAHTVADRLITRLVDRQGNGGTPSLVLTGGGIGIAALAALAESPSRAAVDWGRVDLWWGDERFVAAHDPDRNDGQARVALLDQVDLSPDRVHPMGALGGPDAADPDAAAARYAEELRAAAGPGRVVPAFDVALVGMGPEGHTASIFPESPAAHEQRPVFAVRNCPKPPPTRISMGFTALNAAREVWVVVSGADKAEAVALALSGAGPVQVPVAGVRGTQQTLWLLDEEAASALPRDLRRR